MFDFCWSRVVNYFVTPSLLMHQAMVAKDNQRYDKTSCSIYIYIMVYILILPNPASTGLNNYETILKVLSSITQDSLNQTSGIHRLFFRTLWYKACLLDVIKPKYPCVISERKKKYQCSPRLRHTFGWGTCRACLSLPTTAGLVETYLHCVMALLTLHRIPSIATAPVSSAMPTPCCPQTNWACCIIISFFTFALQRVIQN